MPDAKGPTEDTPPVVRRLGVEAMVIVLSILAAFSIDAWWEDRGERRAERALLQRLQADFLAISDSLDVVVQEHWATRDACLVLLALGPGETVPATQAFDRKVATIFLAVRTFNPGSGAIASFLNGDSARLISNQRLSDALIAWPGLVEELQEDELSMVKASLERWTPFLASRVDFGPYYYALNPIVRGMIEPTPRPEAIAPLQFDQEVSERIRKRFVPAVRQPLRIDQEFTNHVLERYKWQQVALRDLAPVQAAVNDILDLLASEFD